ncbi:MAG: lactate dehydrogenase [Clostridium sp.]|nr:lactate dehydrogenase [Clostridium sp.]
MKFYEIDHVICCSDNEALPFGEAPEERRGEVEVYLFEGEWKMRRSSFLVNDPALLCAAEENASWLSSLELHRDGKAGEPLPKEVQRAIEEERLRAVNLSHPQFRRILTENLPLGLPKDGKKPAKKVVHVLAIGDVGSNLLTGLHLLGGDCISRIGICDISDKITARWEFEENQIAYPWDYNALPEVYVVDREHLFACDVFVFIASAGIPAVGSGVKDVRMWQLERNSKIIADYAKQARREHFKGLFCEVADPVDPLAKAAYLASNEDENGNFDGMGLLPEQIQGFGLGVMNARAAYYAKRDNRFMQFLTEGRTFGPHGQELVVANSIKHYDDSLSRELTELTVTANMKMRELGFKPYVAPAFSSGALSILLTIRGEWHCGSIFLGGIYMGVKNRYTPFGQEHEILPMPEALYKRIKEAEDHLHTVN